MTKLNYCEEDAAFGELVSFDLRRKSVPQWRLSVRFARLYSLGGLAE